MTDRLPAGPYRTIDLGDGGRMPYYIIPFDKRGVCQGPETRAHLLRELENGGYSDVFLFSHGWNNDWTVATERYENFIGGYMKMRRDRALAVPDGFKPLLVGIFWPSTALVFTDAEKGPDIAAADPGAIDEAIAEERRELDELAAELEPEQAEALYRLAQQETLSEAQARELAEIALALRGGDDDELGLDDSMSADELVEVWKAEAAESEADDDIDDLLGGGGGAQAAGAGGLLSKLDPRKLVRSLTVYQMKDRAGRVGARGVGPLLRDVLAGCDARVHLIGHSYGGKIVLSATSFGGDLPRKVRSMLLLQPAVSHLCFADVVPTTDRPGGYRVALERVENPIFSTFSRHDVPLTQLFHNALRRKGDLGEAKIAAAGDPPSKYAALGGFGPRRAGQRIVDIKDAGDEYELEDGVEIYGLEGSRTIKGHGKISNESTWWALYSTAMR